MPSKINNSSSSGDGRGGVNKLIANRIAQRKFRRQRKDYVANLERELEMCRAGSSQELLQRRQEVEKLRAEHGELVELLHRVSTTLTRIVGSDTRAPPPASETSLDGDNRDVEPTSDSSSQNQAVELGLDSNSVFSQLNLEDPLLGQCDTSLSTVTTEAMDNGYDISNASQFLSQITNVPAIADQLSLDIGMSSSHTNATESSFCVGSNLRLGISSPSSVHPETTMALNSTDQAVRSLRSVAWPIRQLQGKPPKYGLEVATYTHLLYIRHVEEFLDSYLAQPKLSTLPLHVIDTQITRGLTQIIARTMKDFFSLLPTNRVGMLGGCAWLLWQVTKSRQVTPRLARCSYLTSGLEAETLPYIFRDTEPEFLKPTTIQLSFDHCHVIDVIPWPSVRNRIILSQESVPLDEFFADVMQRWIPTMLDEDKFYSPAEVIPNLHRQIMSEQGREYRDTFYGCLTKWQVRSSAQCPGSAYAAPWIDTLLDNVVVVDPDT